MNKVTEILQAARDDPSAAEHLLPLIYDELRRLASRRMGDERINHTLQPTALVHEAYIRLVGEQQADQPQWEGRAHFFAAAAEAMRRILIDRARRKQSLKRGGQRVRQPLNESEVAGSAETNELFAVDEALTKLATRCSYSIISTKPYHKTCNIFWRKWSTTKAIWVYYEAHLMGCIFAQPT